MSEQIERDYKIDFLRGLAAIIVVLGHSLQQFKDYEFSPIFNVIFSVQMPLFMFISGYVVLFQKRIASVKDLFKYIFNRSIALLLPWLMWSLISFFILWKNISLIEYVKHAAFHMEDAYWFLFSLWTISIMYCLAFFLSNVFSRFGIKPIVCSIFYYLFYVVLMVLIGLIGLKIGMEFLAIKYSLYYSLFFNAGIIVSKIRKSNYWDKLFNLRAIVFVCSLIGYILLIHFYNIMLMEDSISLIIIRFVISFMGCYLLWEFAENIKTIDILFVKLVIRVGLSSLELYVVHWLLMFSGIIKTGDVSCLSINGIFLSSLYFIIIGGISLLIIKIIKSNPLSNLIMFGKRFKNIKTL